jgi:sialic acid synthase SpsE/quercetin dioxygenase-like cupin family protein
MRLGEHTPLFILEMANNHMGSLEHGKHVIREFRRAVEDFPFAFAFKLQYRDLDTFIHPAHKGSAVYPYVRRFEETRLTHAQLRALRDEIGEQGFIAVCTPFDEASVDLIEEHEFDVIKVASCSFTDWPLLERIAASDKPIIASCAGTSLEDVDRVVSFFEHRRKDMALLHCVAEYPVRPDGLQLNQIDLLKQRYPGVLVGFSTHEDPTDTTPVRMAVAKGATILEKHVGVATEEYALNAYSASPDQVHAWVAAAGEALESCGSAGVRYESSDGERSSLLGLRRGVFAARDLAAGEVLTLSDVLLAIPTLPGQLTANDLSKYTQYTTRHELSGLAPVMVTDVDASDHREQVHEIIDAVRDLLLQSGLAVPAMVDLEISHHYGLERFHDCGLTMLSIVNREYCKKLLILLPGQRHPEQYHEQKEETFHVLHGDLELELDGDPRSLGPGDVVTVERGVHHAFRTEGGAVIEEISTTHCGDDSFYVDAAIAENTSRKTFVTHWMA